MRVGVTGGAGFIGSFVVDELIQKGHEPLIFDHIGRTHRTDVEVMLGDVRDSVTMVEMAAHVDGIIHLAAVLGTQETIKNPRPAVLSNIEGGLNFLEALDQYDLPGTYIAVGNHWMNNSYSISKTTVERFVNMYNKERKTRANIVRVVNAYGPRQRPAPPFGPGRVRKITPSFICRALSGMPVEVYGDGLQVSDMVYVDDVALALVRSLEEANDGKIFDEVIEVGPEEHHTVYEVAKEVISICEEFGYEPVNIINLPMRPGEIPGSKVIANTSTLELIGLSSSDFISLRDGMTATVEYFINSKGQHWNDPRT